MSWPQTYFSLWRGEQPNPTTVYEIARQVCERHGVRLEELRARGMAGYLVAARCEIAYRARRETKASYPRIAAYLHAADHTSAIHWERRWPHYAKKFGFDVENPILSPTAPTRAVA